MALNPLSLYSEPYGATGNIGENFLRLLGTPSLSRLQTVIREALQNIADAAKLGRPADILIRVRALEADERTAMRERIFVDLPAEQSSRARLQEFLDNPSATILEICDFGTTGLGGPTRADRIPIGMKEHDFINFLRNIGAPRDTAHGGGTYGFGKASLYAVSKCNTILVDTLVANEPAGERRLIGCHVGSHFEVPEDGMRRQFTGRHWWGAADPIDGVADPVTGIEAEDLTGALGLPERGPGQTGTSIMILDLETEGESVHAIGRRIVEGILWSFWPRLMVDTPAEKKFNCTVVAGDQVIDVPPPEHFPPLDLFCKAMRAVRAREGSDVRPIFSRNRKLGLLAIEQGLRSRRQPLVEAENLFPASSQHIALMRPVQLVVKYLEGGALPDENLEWAGVFVVDDDVEVERAFALSEPPAHDDWVTANLEKGPARTFVRVALRELQSRAQAFGDAGGRTEHSHESMTPLARVAGRLGAALEGVGGDGAGPSRGGGAGKTGRRSRPTASRPTFIRLARENGRKVAIFGTDVRQDPARTGESLQAAASIAIDGSSSNIADSSIEQPKVIRITPEIGEAVDGDVIELGGADGRYEIAISIPDGCAVTVDARVVSGGDT